MLETEICLFNEKIDSLVKESLGKYVLIKESNIIGVFESFDESITNATRLFGLDSYLLREIRNNYEKVSIPALTIGVLNANISYAIPRKS